MPETDEDIFAHEKAVLERARAVEAKGDASPEDFTALTTEYARLLKQSGKLVRLGDNTQNKLLRARSMLERAIQHFQRMAEEKSEMLGVVTHDLKNRAAPMVALVDHLDDELGEDASESTRECLELLRTCASEMLDSTQQLISRVAERDREIVPVYEPVRIDTLLQGLFARLRPYARKKQVTLHLEGAEMEEISADEFLLGEVFDNLLNNAIKFSPTGRTVYVSCSREEPDRLVVEVRDEGQGMTSEDLEKVFGRYARLSAKPTGGEASSGLGLSIVKKLVELHQGTVSVQSEGSGKGTRFRVNIPRKATWPALL